ncbi:MAG: DUF3021 domain-containing protein [Clostridia bacterium]|nr:DUF3021 domain-containing protein [Clostridia bacterium]
MNRYVKEFLHRGLVFGGFGPVILGIIYAFLEGDEGFSLNGPQVLIAIVSIYLLAFVHAGASVFNQIESFSVPKALLCHFSVLYAAYVGCYLINDWIPFDSAALLIFTAVFVVAYFVVWFAVFLSVKAVSRKLNARLKR